MVTVIGRLPGARAALLLIATFAVIAAPARASDILHGQTGQGRAVTLTVGDARRVERLTISWTARCRAHGGALRDGVTVNPRRPHTTPGAFRVAGSYRFGARGGYRVTSRLVVGGRLQSPTPERWTGTIRVASVVRRHGKVVDRCRLPSTAWSATLPAPAQPAPVQPSPGSPPPASPPPPSSGAPPTQPSANPNPAAGPWKLTMTSDPGDYVGAGRPWADGSPEHIQVTAERNRFQFFIDRADGGWWLGTIEAPDGEGLAAKTYGGAQRFGGPGHGGLDIGGMGRGCNQVTGQFTVREIVFDASGTLRSFKVDFEQHCEGAIPALRGTLEFQSA